MTIEQTKPRSVYTIATTGPYALRDSGGNPWPYVADGLTVSVIKDGVITDLIGAGWFTVSPASGTNGNLTLTAAALAAYAGAQLVITRDTPIEQAWQATQGPREVGLAAQLDRLAMGLQDQAVDASGALRLANQTVPPAALTSGHVVLFEGGKFVDGPAPGEIVNAAANAQIATTKAAEAAASTTSAGQSATASANSATAASASAELSAEQNIQAQNASLASQSSAGAANAALLGLGSALVQGIGAVTIVNGNMILTYNNPFITGATLVNGNLVVTY